MADLLESCHQISFRSSCSQVQRDLRGALESKISDSRAVDFATRLCELTCDMKKKGMNWFEARSAIVTACTQSLSIKIPAPTAYAPPRAN